MEHARAATAEDQQSEPGFVSLTDTSETSDEAYDDGPEFSSEPMPAAFGACLFLGLGLLICLALALFL